MVRAVDCRSAGPWFNSGWRSWFTFMTWSSNQIIQMINIMSPITTSIRTITRMSAKTRALLETAVLQPLNDALEKHGLDDPGILLTFVNKVASEGDDVAAGANAVADGTNAKWPLLDWPGSLGKERGFWPGDSVGFNIELCFRFLSE